MMTMQFRIKYLKRKLKAAYLMIIMPALLVGNLCSAQNVKPLTLEDCVAMASANYPLIRQKDLISKSLDYTISNASKAYLPQITISGQATYQSDVIQFPLKVPGMNIDPLSKDQYKIVADINQPIYDGGVISNQKEMQKASAETEKQKLEVDMYSIKGRIYQIYFGILLLDEQLDQVELIIKDLSTNLNKTKALIANGVAFKMNADLINAEMLKANQKIIEIRSSKKAFIDMLAYFINQQLNETITLVKPDAPKTNQPLSRNELKLFDTQTHLYDVQDKFSNSKLLPKASLFAQTGYGKPGLNMLKNEFDFFYIAGVRVSWNFSSLYSFKNEKMINGIGRDMIGVQREMFLFNTNMILKQQNSEVEKLLQLIESDKEIVKLRTEIKNTAQVQLDKGVITTNDYLRELNAEDQAKQNIMLHRMQLLMAQYNYSITNGN